MKWFLFITVAGIATAMAQQAQSPQSPNESVLGTRLMQEINRGIQCEAQFLTAQKHVTDLEAQVKTLLDKYEPKSKETPKKP